MVTIYNADIWCDDCGQVLAAEAEAEGRTESGDSDDYPSIGHLEEETDSPQHCAACENCENAIDLCMWGLKETDELIGAEHRYIGDICGDELTPDGARYLKEMLAEPCRTPYQEALHNLWREHFSQYLEDEEEED